MTLRKKQLYGGKYAFEHSTNFISHRNRAVRELEEHAFKETRRASPNRRRRLHRLGRDQAICSMKHSEPMSSTFDKLTYAARLNVASSGSRGNSRHRLAKVDIRDGSALRQLFEEFEPRHATNLAAEEPCRSFRFDGPSEFIQTNIRWHLHALCREASRHWRRLDRQRQQEASSPSSHIHRIEADGNALAPGADYRNHAVRAELALRRLQSIVRSSGPRMARNLRIADDRH